MNLQQEVSQSIERTKKDAFIPWLCVVVGGWLSPGHGNIAGFEFALRTMPKGGNVLEIGSFLGLSTIMLSYFAEMHRRQTEIYSADPWEFEGTEEPIGGYFDASRPDYQKYARDVFKRNVTLFCPPNRLPYTFADRSHSFLRRWAAKEDAVDVHGRRKRLGSPLSFAYIDGAHSYEGAIGDFHGIDPFILPGGYVLFDDTGYNWPEMNRVVAEMAANPAYQLLFTTPNHFYMKKP